LDTTGPKTELTGRSSFRKWWSAWDCSAITEDLLMTYYRHLHN